MLLEAREAAAFVSDELGLFVKPSDLQRAIARGRGPAFMVLDGRRRVYRPEALRAWASSRLVAGSAK